MIAVFMVHWFSFLYLVLFLPGAGCGGSAQGPREGQRAPAFNSVDTAGSAVAFEPAGSTPTMVVFWASWCGPCRAETPAVQQVARSYGSSVRLLGVNAGEDPQTARRAMAQLGITWPVVLDVEGAVRAAYEVSSIPMVVILDKNGLVRHRNNGVPSDVHRILDGLL